MSWGGLPWWVFELEAEHRLAECSCCFPEELYSGISKVAPKHLWSLHRSVFATHEPNGWWYGRDGSNRFDGLFKE